MLSALVGSALLVACSGSGHPNPIIPAPNGPNVVNAEPAGGSPGVGPVVAPPPVTAPGGHVEAQRVQLPGRSITINAVTTQTDQAAGPTAVVVDLTISNEGVTPVANTSTAYTVIGPEGDTFGAVRVSEGFAGPISAGVSRRGTVEFSVPGAAAKSLRLLYRPGDGSESVLAELPAA